MESTPTKENKLSYKSKLIPSDDMLRQLVNSAVDKDGECPENFKCNICHCLLYDPQECSNCDQLFCKFCI